MSLRPTTSTANNLDQIGDESFLISDRSLFRKLSSNYLSSGIFILVGLKTNGYETVIV